MAGDDLILVTERTYENRVLRAEPDAFDLGRELCYHIFTKGQPWIVRMRHEIADRNIFQLWF
jgi:hypothetical protein